jgi:hypothetical protein
MAHTYVITSAVNSGGDVCTITGTVDGFPVTITPWLSLINQQPSTVAIQNLIAPLMLAAAVANGNIAAVAPSTVPSVTAAGTFLK